jgi:hypothetical protein
LFFGAGAVDGHRACCRRVSAQVGKPVTIVDANIASEKELAVCH